MSSLVGISLQDYRSRVNAFMCRFLPSDATLAIFNPLKAIWEKYSEGSSLNSVRGHQIKQQIASLFWIVRCNEDCAIPIKFRQEGHERVMKVIMGIGALKL